MLVSAVFFINDAKIGKIRENDDSRKLGLDSTYES